MAPCILVVEDDDDVRDLLVETVERAGYEVAFARHGGEALAWLAAHRPAAIVLDLMMPVVDGWTVLSKLDRRIPVVVLSAVAQRDVVLPPAVMFLPKPVRKDALLQAIAVRTAEKRPAVELALYVADGCERSSRAIEILAEVLSKFEPSELQCVVHNVARVDPAELEEDGIHTTPSLIVRRPLPLRLVGDLRGTRFLTTLLDVAEISRRPR